MPTPPAPSDRGLLASIVIVAWGKRAVTEQCLGTLERSLGDALGTRYELVLVDNDSPDDTAELFEQWADRATVVSLPRNLNFSGGCNAGAHAASGEVLVFLNNDTEVPPGAIETVAEQALEPGVGAVGARLLYPDGSIQHAGVVWRRGTHGMTLPYHLFHHSPGQLPAAGGVFDLDCVTGACLAMRRELFHELGGFDEEYVNGLEDVDLCVKIRVAGHRIVYRGDVAILHHESLTRGKDPSEAANLRVLYPRWGHLFGDDDGTLDGLFGAMFHPNPLVLVEERRSPLGAPVTLEGEVTSIAPDAAEARALLSLFESAGLEPALRDRQPNMYGPQLAHRGWAALALAGQRVRREDAVSVRVPLDGERAPRQEPDVVRVASLPSAERLASRPAVWAATPALSDRLVREGYPAARVHVLPPIIEPVDLGHGGDGILAVLPAHDAAACALMLDGLAAQAAGAPIRILPTVVSLPVLAQAAELLPDAEVLRPITNEGEFAALAATSEVVVCRDATDHFDRRALIAAATGAAIVTLADGPAAHYVPSAVAPPRDAGAGALSSAIACALEAEGAREQRRDAVLATCSPAVLGPQVAALLETAQSELRQAAA